MSKSSATSYSHIWLARSCALIHDILFLIAMVAATSSGCHCTDAPEPVDITTPNGDPKLTGARVQCNCKISFSQEAQTKAKLPAEVSDVVKPCLPVDYTGREKEFCEKEVESYEQHLAEALGLFVAARVTPNPGAGAICGGTSLFDTTDPNPVPKEGVTVACTVEAIAPPYLSTPDSACKPLDGETNVCTKQFCDLTDNVSEIPPKNCLVQSTSISRDQCNCTNTNANCAHGTTDRPICFGRAQSIASPLTAATSRRKSTTVDPSASSLGISIDVEVLCDPIFDSCVKATGSQSPHLSGELGLYGGPCPGSSCNVQLDGVIKVDDFSLRTSGLGFTRTDSISDARITISAMDPIAVGPDGSATILPGKLTYNLLGYHDGKPKSQASTNQFPANMKIDWNARTFTVKNLRYDLADGSGTLNLRGTFEASVLEILERLPAWDTDGDDVPDRLDNCPRVQNANQTPIAPTFGEVPPLTLTACTAGDAVTIPPPPVSDPCDKLVTLTGQVISVDGVPITPIPVDSAAPITIQPLFDANGLRTTPQPVPTGSAVLPVGTVTIQWTATDANKATATITQIVKSSITPTLYATATLIVGPGAVVQTSSSAPATIVNPSANFIELRVDASAGNILSGGQVVLGNRALVTGFLDTAGTVVLGKDSSVVEKLTQNDPAIVFPPAPALPSTAFTDGAVQLEVQPWNSLSLSPGDYGAATILPHATLRLAPGTYRFAALDLQPASFLEVDSSKGPITILVQHTLELDGATVTDIASPQTPDILIGYFGAARVAVKGPFNGALFAPNASVTLNNGPFIGQFAALNLDVASHTTVIHRPYHCAR